MVFDPSSFFGHAEFELGIAHMFGGVGSAFFRAYHAVIPKQEGFERRNQLYQLFHNLNHWSGPDGVGWMEGVGRGSRVGGSVSLDVEDSWLLFACVCS